MDGSGKPAFRADVLVSGNLIEDVGLFPQAEAVTVVDASGLVVAPGSFALRKDGPQRDSSDAHYVFLARGRLYPRKVKVIG